MLDQTDYSLFARGALLWLIAVLAWVRARPDSSMPLRAWITWFGLLHGALQWVEMALLGLGWPTADHPAMAWALGVFRAVSFLPLIEWGRRRPWPPGGRPLGVPAYLPLIVPVVMGTFHGFAGFDVSSRAAAGFWGCSLAGLALWRGARPVDPEALPLRLAALGLFLYGLTAVFGSAVPPDSVFSRETFEQFTSLPLHGVSTACTLLAALGLCLALSPGEEGTPGGTVRLARLAIPGFLAILLITGCWLANRQAQLSSTAHRKTILAQATAIARIINADRVMELTFTEADRAHGAFQRMREQMTAYAEAMRFRGLYSMALRDGELIFGPESLAEADPLASPPGTLYRKPPEAIWEVLRTKEPRTTGPYTDEYGSFVSAFAPVLNRRTGEVILVLGIDVEASTWNKAIARVRLHAILLMIPPVLCFLIGALVVLRRRENGRPGPDSGAYRAEAMLTAAMGIILTVIAAYLVHGGELHDRQALFSRFAETQSADVARALVSIRDDQLEGLTRLFEASQEVTRSEFRTFSEYLGQTGAVQAFKWAPVVNAGETERVAENARRDGFLDFQVWTPDDSGAKTAHSGPGPFYPILYVEPLEENQSLLGLDLGSWLPCRAAIDTAVKTGFTTATDLLSSVRPNEAGQEVLVVQPVHALRGALKEPLGLVLAALKPEILIRQAVAPMDIESTTLVVELFQLTPGQPPQLLASTSSRRPFPDGLTVDAALGGDLRQVTPVFAFGKSYAVVAFPSQAFLAAYPPRAAWAASLIGLLLTALMTALIAFLNSRRAYLEHHVSLRTAELRESEAAQRILIDNLPAGVLIIDPETRVIEKANRSASLLIGAPIEAIQGRICHQFLCPAEWGHCPVCDLDGDVDHSERILLRADGTQLPVLKSVIRIRLRGEEKLLELFLDTSERKRAEEEKDRLQAQLLQSQKMESVGRLAGGVAHDFNNKIQAILGFTSLALNEIPQESRIHQWLSQVIKAAQQSADLTRQLLAFARRQTIKLEVLDLNDTISGMLKMLQRLVGENIELHWMSGRSLWKVKMDPTQVDQVLANLVVNSRDAIVGTGRISLQTENVTLDDAFCSLHPGAVSGDYVLLTLSDTGSGMSKETLERLFEPFYTTKELGKGTGLGLATVYGIVKQNRGFIDVVSEPGEGAIFRIYLPRSDGEDPVPLVNPSASMPRGGTETVLLVEDEEAILTLGNTILGQLGYKTLTAGRPGEAIRLAEEYPEAIHLLITDVVMPEMNGRELAERLTRIKPGMKCLFMSGYTDDAIAHHGVLDEGVRLIKKPFSIQQLSEMARKALEE